jgi:hypothetical protein
MSKSNLVLIIKEYVTQANKHYSDVRKRVMEKAATANNDLEPTVDCYGRLHAPCDGYHWEDNIYPGGSYLPLPPEFYEMLSELSGRDCFPSSNKFKGRTTRIKSNISEAKEISESCKDYAKVGSGKVWDDGITCYVYIETTRNKLTELVELYKQEQEEIRKAKIEAERKAKKALKGEAPEGRVHVKGKVLAIKEVQGKSFSYYDSGISYKMLVELENKSTVWGSIPSKIYDVEVGQNIEFTATFSKAENDDTHAFYKRPAKAKLLN